MSVGVCAQTPAGALLGDAVPDPATVHGVTPAHAGTSHFRAGGDAGHS